MFSRTPSGIKNTDLFYRKQYIVIVEGSDDIPFWSLFFPREVAGYERKFKQVGGKTEIAKYVDEVYNNNAKFAIALDSDYHVFMGKIHNHPQIIETLAHSIENLLISPKTLANIIRVDSRQEDYDIKNVECWLHDFDKAVHSLMVVDYLAQKLDLGKQCLGESCFRFLKEEKKKEPFFDTNKIQNFIKNINIPDDIIKRSEQELTQYKPSRHIRGHFFFGSSLCFINYEVNRLRSNKKKRSIANDELYSMLILACEKLFPDCLELQTLREKAIKVAQEVVRLLSSNEV